MSTIATAAAVAASLAGIGRLAATDPKRRRSFGMPPFSGNRQVTLALTAVFLPPVLLLAIGTGADFVAWLGATSVAGWAVAAVSPRRSGRFLAVPADLVRWCRAGVARLTASGRAGLGLDRPTASDLRVRTQVSDDDPGRRLASLERRIEALEAVHAMPARTETVARHSDA